MASQRLRTAHVHEVFAMNTTPKADWEYCEQALRDVSRTFSKPIELLPDQPRVALTCGYLLCRVVDTVEDHPSLGGRWRDELFSRFIDVLDGELPADSFAAAFEELVDHGAEVRLARNLPRVMRVFGGQSVQTRESTVRWVSEMANGMRLYCRRDKRGTLSAVDSVADLERYCYFVAGTVGHLITDLFCEFMGASSSLEQELRGRCESFGVGLQLVNILKDVTDDFDRKRCYVPRQLCRAQGFQPEQLLLSENRLQRQRALGPVFECASRHLDDALEYALLLPARQVQLRLFCLLPLWMARATLTLLVGEDAVFIPDRPVKISRNAVAAIMQNCLRFANDDASLRDQYSAMSAQFLERLTLAGQLEQHGPGVTRRYAQA